MTKGVATVVVLLALAACSGQDTSASPNPSPSPNPTPNGVFWQGESAGWRWSWTADDIRAVKDGRSFSLAALLRADFDRDMQALGGEQSSVQHATSDDAPQSPLPCTRETTAAVLSIVGSLLSYRATQETTCAAEAHPDGETRYATINLDTDPSRAGVVLDALFPQAAIADALRNDTLVKRQLAAKRAGGSLADLTRELATIGGVMTSSDCYSFPDDLTARFAFHHVDAGRVAVRIGLPGAGPCRTRLTQLGVMLPVPQSLAHALAQAAAGQQGLLIQRAEQLGGTTHWTWRSEPKK